MECITSNDFLMSVLEADAWKEISRREPFSMEMIEKYADVIDWNEISINGYVVWTVEGIDKFSRRINWDEFSRHCPDNLISEATLKRFSGHWNWKIISNRDEFVKNWDFLEKFADLTDWNEIINNWSIENPFGFLNRFQRYIPMAKLQNSRLWDIMVEARAKELFKGAIGTD